ncbi:MAG TPA: hypothetical protein VKU40_18425 [Thermoanaerobaculia bacterium]|nr:hypothetical protein [Thermoanaerobaculia bacterium]
MDLSKKTTVLFPPALHEHLTRLAAQRRTSLGDLVRRACESQYDFVSAEDRLKAVHDLAALSLPVGSVAEMKRQSVPEPEDLS